MEQPLKQGMVSVGKRNAKKKYSDEFVVLDGKKTKMYVVHEKIFEVNTPKENHENNNARNGTVLSFNFNHRVDKQEQNKVNKLMLQKEILKHDNSLSGNRGIKKNTATNNLAIHQNLTTEGHHNEIRNIYRCNTRKGCSLWEKQFHENKSVKLREKTNLQQLLTKTKFFKCKPCGKSFKDRTTLWLHKNKHPNTVKAYKCDLCNREFVFHRWLSDHMLRHSDQKNFPCGLCGKKYMTKSDARMHERRHTKLAIFVCSKCDKKFIYQSELKAHLQKHQGIQSSKNIKCEICTKAFATRRDLGRHLTVHTGAKPFKCEICEKSFSQEINLQVHIKTHTGDKPYHCDVCLKKFIVKSKLIRHQQCHSTAKGLLPRPFQCILCTKKYTAENSLIRHLKLHKSSPETVTKLTSALTKALEDSKMPDSSASVGGVLACLIDQAICDARRVARETRTKDPSLATIIDQAIHDSKSAASSTQTRTEEETVTIPVDAQQPSSSLEDSVLKMDQNLEDKSTSKTIPKDPFTCSYLLKLISEAVGKSNISTEFAKDSYEKFVFPLQLETNSSGISETVRFKPQNMAINSASALNYSCRQLKHRSIVSFNQRVEASMEQLSSNIIVPSSSNSEMYLFMASDDTFTNPNQILAETSFNNTFTVISPPQLPCTHQSSQKSTTLPHHKVQHVVCQNSMSECANMIQAVQLKEDDLTSALENNGAYATGTIQTQQTGLSQNISRLLENEQVYLIQPRSGNNNNGLILSASSSSKVQPFVVTASNGQTFLLESTPISLEHSPQFLLASDIAAVNEDIEVHHADVQIV